MLFAVRRDSEDSGIEIGTSLGMCFVHLWLVLGWSFGVGVWKSSRGSRNW